MIVACVLSMLPGTAMAESAKEVFAGVYRGVVVVIAANAEGGRTSQGSGVVVERNEVVSNCQVVSGASETAVLQATDPQGRTNRRMAAKPMAGNEARDLCLLFADQLSEPPEAVAVPLGNTRDLSIGGEVYAVGAPHGLELSLSRGVISQLRYNYDERLSPLIQTDAAVSPGSSGGGLFNGEGELIGVTSFKLSGEGSEDISFAAPVEWMTSSSETTLTGTARTA